MSVNDNAQTSRPSIPNAKKCAALSIPGIIAIISAGGCEDSIKSIVIQPLIDKIIRMIRKLSDGAVIVISILLDCHKQAMD